MRFSELDLKLKLLSGLPVKVDDRAGKITPLTLRQIVDYGYSEYLKRLNIIAVELKDLVDRDVSEIELGLNVFDILTDYGGKDVVEELEKSLGFFYNDTAKLIPKSGIIVIGSGESIIDRDNFDKVRDVIKWQNGVNKFGENDSDDATDQAKEILEKLKRAKQITSKVKQEEGEGELDLSDMISAIASKSHSINKLNVFDLTLFQFYDEFKRLELIDQYSINIKSMLAGAKNVKLKHWSSKLD